MFNNETFRPELIIFILNNFQVTEDHVPTLDMAPHHLKPAVEGSEIAYEAYHDPPLKEHN
jgi:hypothetical protein